MLVKTCYLIYNKLIVFQIDTYIELCVWPIALSWVPPYTRRILTQIHSQAEIELE